MIGLTPCFLAARCSSTAPFITPWSVRPSAGCPNSAARAARASMLHAPSSSEYSEWTCRWAQAGVLTEGRRIGAAPDATPARGRLPRTLRTTARSAQPDRQRRAELGRRGRERGVIHERHVEVDGHLPDGRTLPARPPRGDPQRPDLRHLGADAVGVHLEASPDRDDPEDPAEVRRRHDGEDVDFTLVEPAPGGAADVRRLA